MSPLLAVGLFLQIVALLMVLKRVGHRWFSHVGVLFLFMAFVFHGVTEIVQALFPGHNFYRALVSRDYIDLWVFVVSWALLLFALVYSMSLRKEQSSAFDAGRQRIVVMNLPDWWLLFLILAPGYILLVSSDIMNYGYWISGVIRQFLLVSMVLAFLKLLMRHNRALLLIVVIQSMLVLLIGRRLSIIAAAVMLLSTAERYRIPIRLKHLFVISLMIAVGAAMISGARVTVGREVFSNTLSERASALVDGLSSLQARDARNQILDDFIYRFDGNSFAAMVYAQLTRGVEPAGLRPLWNNVLLSIPSFMYPNKLDGPVYLREEETYMVTHYGLPIGIDYLPTTLGIIFGYYGALFLLVVAAGMGYLFALVDRWLHRRGDLLALLVGIGLTYSIVFMEQGLRVYFITFRGILILYLLLSLMQIALLLFRGVHRSPSRSMQRNLS